MDHVFPFSYHISCDGTKSICFHSAVEVQIPQLSRGLETVPAREQIQVRLSHGLAELSVDQGTEHTGAVGEPSEGVHLAEGHAALALRANSVDDITHGEGNPESKEADKHDKHEAGDGLLEPEVLIRATVVHFSVGPDDGFREALRRGIAQEKRARATLVRRQNMICKIGGLLRGGVWDHCGPVR